MAAPAPSRFAPGRASDGSVLVQGPSAGLPSPKGSHPSGGHIGDEAHSHAHKKSLGKSFTSFFKGLFSSSSSSSKSKDAIHNSHSSALDASREGPQKSSKSLTAAISPVSTLSPQASYNKHADLDHASSSITAVAAVTASPYSKSQSCSVAAHKSNTLHQELLNGTVAAAPGPTSPDTRKISSRSALQGFGDSLDSLTLRQPSRTFMELRAQAQVIPTKGNQLLAVCPNLPAKMNRAIWTMKDYAIVEKMYKGYASTVYKAFCKRSGELVCLKAYDMANLCELNRCIFGAELITRLAVSIHSWASFDLV